MTPAMKKALKGAMFCGAVSLAAAALSGCAGPYYATAAGYDYDDYAYTGAPYYYGDVFVDGEWYSGPMRYRDIDGQREYYMRGAWRPGLTRGEEGRAHERLLERVP